MCKLIASTMLLVMVTHSPGVTKPSILFCFPHWACTSRTPHLCHSSFSSFKFLLPYIGGLPSNTVLLHQSLLDFWYFSATVLASE